MSVPSHSRQRCSGSVRTLYLKTQIRSKHEMIHNLMLDLLHEHYHTTDPFPMDAKDRTD